MAGNKIYRLRSPAERTPCSVPVEVAQTQDRLF